MDKVFMKLVFELLKQLLYTIRQELHAATSECYICGHRPNAHAEWCQLSKLEDFMDIQAGDGSE